MTSYHLIDRNACPLCGSSRHRVHIDFPELPVLQCSDCAFIYSGKVFSPESLSAYYANNFGSPRQMQGQKVNSLVNLMALGRMVDLGAQKKVLDIGTGYGFLLKKISDLYGTQTTGVELSHQEAEYATQTLGLNVINTPLAESSLAKGAFDLVSSFEVLEHIPMPKQFILELLEYVRPGGFLLVMTDNFEGRMATALGPAFPKWIPHTHISHFSARTLQKTLEEIPGLQIIKSMSYTPWEIVLRNTYYKARNITKTPAEAFSLDAAMRAETHGHYKLFRVRQLINKLWARLTLRQEMDGDLMYFLCKKAPL